MTASQIRPDSPSTNYTILVDFTFKGVVIGVPTPVPVSFDAGSGLINWAFSFASIPGTGTSGAFVINCPDLAYLPDQYFGFVFSTSASYQASLAAGKITSTATLTQGGRITVFGILSNFAIVNM
jgi:hypothetical protein